jgi:hypothetical protein
MSHRNSASSETPNDRIVALVVRAGTRGIALLSLVLVLLITNGGAG